MKPAKAAMPRAKTERMTGIMGMAVGVEVLGGICVGVCKAQRWREQAAGEGITASYIRSATDSKRVNARGTDGQAAKVKADEEAGWHGMCGIIYSGRDGIGSRQ